MRLARSGCIELLLPFDAVTQAQLRRVRPRGVWLARRGCWQFPLEAALELRRGFGARFQIEPDLLRWMAWLEQPLPPLPPTEETRWPLASVLVVDDEPGMRSFLQKVLAPRVGQVQVAANADEADALVARHRFDRHGVGHHVLQHIAYRRQQRRQHKEG